MTITETSVHGRGVQTRQLGVAVAAQLRSCARRINWGQRVAREPRQDYAKAMDASGLPARSREALALLEAGVHSVLVQPSPHLLAVGSGAIPRGGNPYGTFYGGGLLAEADRLYRDAGHDLVGTVWMLANRSLRFSEHFE